MYVVYVSAMSFVPSFIYHALPPTQLSSSTCVFESNSIRWCGASDSSLVFPVGGNGFTGAGISSVADLTVGFL